MGDRVVVEKWVSGDGVKRGGIIVFEDPDHWLPDEQTGNPIQRGIRTVAEATYLSRPAATTSSSASSACL